MRRNYEEWNFGKRNFDFFSVVVANFFKEKFKSSLRENELERTYFQEKKITIPGEWELRLLVKQKK